eukprot:8879528-Heterocapsa_arctica.AAC.1
MPAPTSPTRAHRPPLDVALPAPADCRGQARHRRGVPAHLAGSSGRPALCRGAPLGAGRHGAEQQRGKGDHA